jgi:hypothetical protein
MDSHTEIANLRSHVDALLQQALVQSGTILALESAINAMIDIHADPKLLGERLAVASEAVKAILLGGLRSDVPIDSFQDASHRLMNACEQASAQRLQKK